ncbi:MAG: NAD(P)H-hydrate dehydratase [Pseudomonadota bacterium]
MTATLPTSLYRAEQVRELDRIAIEERGIPGLCLMERAGAITFEAARTRWSDAKSVCVVCGWGNNGGDGYVIARLAHIAGYQVSVLHPDDSRNVAGDALATRQYLEAVGLAIQPFDENIVQQADMIVDAMFGTGLKRPIEGIWADAVDTINSASGQVVSVDIPSGLSSDTGVVLGAAVQADLTATYIGLKRGLFTGSGPDYCGEVVFDDLDIPNDIYEDFATDSTLLDQRALDFPRRPRASHKGSFGHVLVVGGEEGFTGAIRLTAEAAIRVGCGKISLATRASHAGMLNLTRPEVMSHGVESIEALNALFDGVDVIAVGPGLGKTEWSQRMLDTVIASGKPLVVDADALNLLAGSPQVLSNTVMTPHPGEAARLLNCSTKDIHTNRFQSAEDIRLKYGGICVLKGAGSIISYADRPFDVCTAGNPGMACGGMGDLLTGVIAGLIGQGFPLGDAARLGVCLHAVAGDKVAEQGERGLMPTDLLPWLRHFANMST